MKFPSLPILWINLAAVLVAPILLTCCDNKPQQVDQGSQEELEVLQKAKSKLEAEIKSVREEADKRQSELQKRNDELQKTADEAKAQFEKLQDEAAKARNDLEEYKAKYKAAARGKLKGQSIATLQTTDSKTFQAVVLREVTPTEVQFAHSGGVSRLSLDKLPAEFQKKFLYDPEEVKRLEEAKSSVASSIAGLEGIDVKIVQKDPNRPVNPISVQNLRSRILTRQQEIEKIQKEGAKVKSEGDDRTHLGQLRLRVLTERAERIRGEIKDLAMLLNKELNG